MHKIGPIINRFAGVNSRSHSSKKCMAYDEIADLILELTYLYYVTYCSVQLFIS